MRRIAKQKRNFDTFAINCNNENTYSLNELDELHFDISKVCSQEKKRKEKKIHLNEKKRKMLVLRINSINPQSINQKIYLRYNGNLTNKTNVLAGETMRLALFKWLSLP